jgi:hypothetical protein
VKKQRNSSASAAHLNIEKRKRSFGLGINIMKYGVRNAQAIIQLWIG